MGVRARRRSGTGAYRSTRVAAGAAGRRLGRRGAIGARRGAAPLRGDAAIVDPLLVRGLVGKSFLERLGLRACLAGGRRRGRVRRAQLRKEQQGQGGGARHAAISVFAPGTLASRGGKSSRRLRPIRRRPPLRPNEHARNSAVAAPVLEGEEGGASMRKILSLAAAAALVTASLPAWSQTNPSKSDEQTQSAPGAGGVSKPGTPGQAGGKSGPAAKGSDSAKGTESSGSSSPSSAVPSQDSSKVQGLPGNKSGPSDRAPGEKSSGSSDSSKNRNR